MTLDLELCMRFAREWIDAFNAADLDRIMSHYAPDVELVSPLYAAFSRGASDRVRGTAELRRYFAAALAAYPDLRFGCSRSRSGPAGFRCATTQTWVTASRTSASSSTTS